MTDSLLSHFSQPTRPDGLRRSNFPYVYECPECGAEETVTRREAVNLAAHCSSPAKAAEFVISHLKGWVITLKREPICPDCQSVVG